MKEKWSAVRRWSQRRPTTGGICLVISALFIGLPSLSGFRIGDMILSVSTISGVSTVLLSVLMALCAFATLFWLHTRVVAGLGAMVIALVAFPAANFGGYVLGSLFGIVGASFVLAWHRVPDPADGAAGSVAETPQDETAPSRDDDTAVIEPGVEDTAVIEPVAAAESAPEHESSSSPQAGAWVPPAVEPSTTRLDK